MFLTSVLRNYSRSKVQKLIENGNVLINGIVVLDRALIVKPGCTITVHEEQINNDNQLTPEVVEFDVLYEDDNILVVNKPYGVVVHPGAGNFSGTLVNGLLHYAKDSSLSNNNSARPGIVHRIDKGTSGILVVAKTDNAHAKLAEQFAVHSITRKYVCFVYSTPNISRDVQKLPDGRYKIQTLIGRDKLNRKKMKVLQTGGKNAITIFKVMRVFSNRVASQIECELKTGRTHQIRVHMNYLGASLIGDQVYGRRKKIRCANDDDTNFLYNFNRQALHAAYLKFQHPLTLKDMEFSSPIPEDMKNLNQVLSNI